eukprot:evm.model.scf_1161.3 EVM.evm.TU.scf_1161.3   scf_1161:28413-33635(-)
MPPAASVAIIGPEKDVGAMEAAIRGIAKRLPVRHTKASASVAGASAINQIVRETGKIDAALVHWRFTAPGKEAYSEVIRKTLVEKYPDCPIVAFGKKKKAGTEGKDYHAFLDAEDGVDANDLMSILKQCQNGEIEATYGKAAAKAAKKNRKSSDQKRGSMDDKPTAASGRSRGERKGTDRSRSLSPSPRPPAMGYGGPENASFTMGMNPGVMMPANPMMGGGFGTASFSMSPQPRMASTSPGAFFGSQVAPMGGDMPQGPGLMPQGSPMMPQVSGLALHGTGLTRQGSGSLFGASMGGDSSFAGQMFGSGYKSPSAASGIYSPQAQQQVPARVLSPNQELILHLTEEIERLQKLVEAKKRQKQEAEAASAAKAAEAALNARGSQAEAARDDASARVSQQFAAMQAASEANAPQMAPQPLPLPAF